ncbi:hypothetical protein QFC19_003358 [Naganishia cerealis]|uniref:Uncharacterized protein n=1 Tax=Naganishia cerealis TaxID=610337 RepID=A0ACC2W4M8_9TREE|nr:hypothetical protein QFC19_003358 [Naganishia cerealis]
MSPPVPLPGFHNTLAASDGHPVPELPRTDEGIRVCQVIQLKPEALEEYKKVHQAVFEGVLKALRRSGVVGKPEAKKLGVRLIDWNRLSMQITLSTTSNYH